ncbi:MAG: hypothetical protein EPN45_13525 [Rhizobiaceae bacterium]|nr:MAG: hypothetical protein EPN45_13525 [Rhizobiaceae bacterium]
MSLPTIAMRVCVCLRCGWQWVSRKLDGKPPVRCPHCRSPYWDKPLERETVSVAVKAARAKEKKSRGKR